MADLIQDAGLQWRSMEPFGIEIDHDFSAPLTGKLAGRFVSLVTNHGLVVAHGQSLSRQQQTELLSLLGPILIRRGEDGYISNAGNSGPASEELTFHSDGAYTEHPLEFLSLHAIDVVDGAAPTFFVNAERALAELPEELSNILASHTLEMIAPALENVARRSCDIREQVPNFRGERPGIVVNSHTGRQVVNASEMNTARLVGMPWEESRQVLHQIFDCLYAPDKLYEHVWKMGDLVIWDNMALQHARGPERVPGPRVLQRVIVATEGFAPHALTQEERERLSVPIREPLPSRPSSSGSEKL
jgi:taurine dioxygenase